MRDTSDGVTVRVRVQPRAAREAIFGERAGALVVRLTAPPVDGRANAALVRLLARALGVPAGHVHVLRGASGRDKTLRVESVSASMVVERLLRPDTR